MGNGLAKSLNDIQRRMWMSLRHYASRHTSGVYAGILISNCCFETLLFETFLRELKNPQILQKVRKVSHLTGETVYLGPLTAGLGLL